ncbi:hypothetical protein, partial [Methanosarcina sp. 1.H.A.2.2]|uniref:hypothetical protein n=1 Tax=Methanosarcina sp. 1.H.A.2.2 TaxID=1483601 RepID=UPI001F30FD1D
EFHFVTPRYGKGKWSNYYIFPVIENPSNLKRIRSNHVSSPKLRDSIKIPKDMTSNPKTLYLVICSWNRIAEQNNITKLTRLING